MIRSNLRQRSSLAALLALAAAGFVLGGARSSVGVAELSTRAEPLKPFVYRASHCAACHNQDRAATYYPDERASMICRMNEWATFDASDRHALAHAALTSERGRVIGERLGLDAATAPACLSCHAAPSTSLPGVRWSEGITCVGCHGAYANWVEAHARVDDPAWRGLDRAAKERDFGMADLWSVGRRAALCVSCHVGDPSQGRVLTHAMYAAGHPPLPAFDLSRYAQDEPRHWERLSEKSAQRRERLGLPADPFESTRESLVGSLAALKAMAELAAAQASGTLATAGQETWPDFARFDCTACHHGLRGSSTWRQERGYRHAAGRPPLPEWPGVAAMLSPGGEALGEPLDAWHAAATVRPFGDPQAIATTARQVAAACDRLIERLEAEPIDRSAARALLTRIAQAAHQRIPDYDSARTLAQMVHTVIVELGQDAPPTALSARAELDRILGLSLRSEPTQKTLIGPDYAPRLERAAEYDPSRILQLFSQLAPAP